MQRCGHLSEEHRLSFIWVPLAGSCLEERSLPLVYRMNLEWERKWQPTPVLLPGKPHGERSLAGYGPWGPVGVGLDLGREHRGDFKDGGDRLGSRGLGSQLQCSLENGRWEALEWK